jgi:hypothetical protein
MNLHLNSFTEGNGDDSGFLPADEIGRTFETVVSD